jgi:hypothetical protein
VMFIVALVYFISAVFKLRTFAYCHEQWCVIIWTLRGNLDLIRVVLWTRLRVSFNAYVQPSV